LTMLPVLGFVSGTTSRYSYAPAMGFAWMVAGLLVAFREWIGRCARSTPLGTVTVFTIVAVIVIRFAVFTTKAIQNRLDWFDAYNEYAIAFERAHPEARGLADVAAPYPEHPNVRAEYVQPLLRWTLRSPDLIVHIKPAPSPR
jgi:hypothetical protein